MLSCMTGEAGADISLNPTGASETPGGSETLLPGSSSPEAAAGEHTGLVGRLREFLSHTRTGKHGGERHVLDRDKIKAAAGNSSTQEESSQP